MKTKLFLFASIFMMFNSLAQCPSIPIIIETQEDIDNFSINYPNCTVLTEELRVNGTGHTITNLNGFSAITNAQKIFIHSTDINNFNGLHNLETAVHLSVWFNNNLQNLEGLSSLQSVGALELYINNGLLNVSGAPNLQEIENLSVFNNAIFNDLSQFSFITTLNDLVIGGNELSSLAGLENLHTVNGEIVFSDLPLLHFNELSSLENFNGSLYIFNNPLLQDISVFSEFTLLQDLFVVECTSLANLSGLENIEVVAGTLRIGFMNQLSDLSVFSNLLYAGNLDIYENNNLQSLSGLENLVQIDQTLHLLTNTALTNIEALDNVSTNEVTEVVVAYNSSLSTCTTDFMCTVVNDSSISKFITENGVGCSSVEEIQKECLLGSEDFSISNAVFMYPNPVSDNLKLYVSNTIDFNSVSVYSMLGQKLTESNQKVVDFSNFASGVYFVEVVTNQGTLSKKVVKD